MAKIRQSNLDNSIITGLTEVTTVADDTDVFLVYDTSAGRLKKIQRRRKNDLDSDYIQHCERKG